MNELEKIYLNEVHELVLEFYSSIKSNLSTKESSPLTLVGLLTYPNSGTSWFLRLSQAATGVRNHTVYEHESMKTRGWASRGVYILNSPQERTPVNNEPSLVKSHVTDYGEYDAQKVSMRRYDVLAKNWMSYLPGNTCRHIRLVRNPFDNLRARYHLYIKNNIHSPKDSILGFKEYYRKDLRRYLLWHACCNQVAECYPLLSLLYSDLLDVGYAKDILFQSLLFAGFDVQPKDIERAFRKFPPIYSEKDGIPVHLQYYSTDDIKWVARELRGWLSELSRLKCNTGHFLSHFQRLSRGGILR